MCFLEMEIVGSSRERTLIWLENKHICTHNNYEKHFFDENASKPFHSSFPII